jgi:hypothetical protein
LRTPPRVIIVEPDVDRVSNLQRSIQTVARVDGCTDFVSARALLLKEVPEFLVTNIRLGPDNGLHLVHLAPPSTRSIVYMEPEDPFLLREAQRLGAFVEAPERLAFSLAAYISAALPLRDRRDPARSDRRSAPRGGRRAADVRATA